MLGNHLFSLIENIKKNKTDLKIEILQQISTSNQMQNETEFLLGKGIINKLVNIDVSKINEGGIQGSKFIIVDDERLKRFKLTNQIFTLDLQI
jgi:hypothetical protein